MVMTMGQLVTEKLSKRYGDSAEALNQVSLAVSSSGIFSLIGRNGAGKTTLVRILATELAPTSGGAWIDGIDVVREEKRLREIIAIVPQEARTVSWMTPNQTIRAYLMWRGYGYSEAKKRAEESLARLKLEKVGDKLNRLLSGGTKRKVFAATVLASEAEVIFLDEPTTGLDPISRREFWGILKDVARERFIVLTTHYLEEAEQLADNLAILGSGHLIATGTIASIREKTRFQYSVKLPPKTAIPQVAQGEVIIGKSGEAQIFTNEEEAFAISKRLSEAGSRFSIGPVSLDDIFLQLVGESAHEDDAVRHGEIGWSP
jgi:ABC-2 type transport system ATP-binding protein